MADEKQRTAGELVAYMGADTLRWAEEWARTARGIYERDGVTALIGTVDTPPDLGWMIGWFANAIEAGRAAGMKATCPHADVWRYGDSGAPNPLVLCNTCGASHDTLSDTWA